MKIMAKKAQSLVIGTLRGAALKAYLKPLRRFTQIQKDALIGGLLGDGSLQTGSIKCKHCSYKFDQGVENKDYVDFVYQVFKEFVGRPPTKPRMKDGKIHSYFFRTYRLESLDFYAKQFYSINSLGQRKREVPKLIHRWLNPQSLAFWFMDNGSRTRDGFYLHTENFTLPDVIILQQALGRVFHIQVNVHKDNRPSGTKYKLYIPSSEKENFQKIIEAYILPCFRYKLCDEFEEARWGEALL